MATLTEKIPYYRANTKTGRWHWEPPAKARRLGMKSEALGEDTPKARARARELNEEMRRRMMSGDTAYASPVTPGSLASFWKRYRKTESWKRKGAVTRDEFVRAWRRIEPELGDKILTRIKVADLERFQTRLEREASEYERWRTIKKLRALLKAAKDYGVIREIPGATLPNPQPLGRQEIWTAGQIDRLIRRARALEDETMALAIELIWETAVSPVDARTAVLGELFDGQDGPYLHRPRSKTQAAIYAPLSAGLYARLLAHVAPEGVEPMPGAPLFRRPDGKPFSGPQDFAKRFSRIRRSEFGKDETRKMLDIRRGANVEMKVGGSVQGRPRPRPGQCHGHRRAASCDLYAGDAGRRAAGS